MEKATEPLQTYELFETGYKTQNFPRLLRHWIRSDLNRLNKGSSVAVPDL